MCVFICSVASTENILGTLLKVVTWLTILVIGLILYLYVMVLSTLISLFWFLLNFWDHMGLRFWCIRFYFPNWKISLFLGVTAEFLLDWVFVVFLLGAPVGVPLGMPPLYATSEVVNCLMVA